MPGVGAKTAAALLNHFGDLDSLLDRIDEVAFLRIRGAATCAARLRQHAEQARMCRRLTRIALDAPGASSIETLARQPRQAEHVAPLCEQLRLGAFTRSRLHALLR